jgi:pyrroloquinoline-quinone synthase
VSALLSPEELEARLRRIGEERYHDKHPFHQLLHGGALTLGQVQAWALNRYCYQAAIPRKDAALISRLHDRALRRVWIGRIRDHDGDEEADKKGEPGGIERWLVLTDGLGLDRAYVMSMSGALPAVRFAVEAYVGFVAERSPLEAIASSLTELFAPAVHRQRIEGMLAHYDFVGEEVMAYFRRRLTQAPRDVAFALDYVKREASTPERQRAVLDALRFKCDVLWAQLDALHHAYVTPALPPPGAFVPDGRRERVTPEVVS